jgi:predicted nicotinamide N-methyase
MVPEVELYLSQDEPTGLWEHTEHDTGRSDLPPPFWAYPWAGGIALARYLLDHREQVAGRVVLDVAAGSGLVAIAAARSGAARVVANDIDPMALAAIGLNSAVNGVCVTVIAGDLLGSGPGAPAPAAPARDVAARDVAARDVAARDVAGGDVGGGDAAARDVGGGDVAARDVGADLVVVGDAFYERRMAHRILTYLQHARGAGARVLVGDPGRSYLPSAGLRAVAHYAVPVWAGLEDVDVKPTTVWELC